MFSIELNFIFLLNYWLPGRAFLLPINEFICYRITEFQNTKASPHNINTTIVMRRIFARFSGLLAE